MQKRLRQISPAQIVLGSFGLLILAGALLLMLPISSQSRQVTPFLDALFTATSATCVTGLVVVDTATYWSVFGQAIILLLIQIGGMGVVTMAVIVSVLSGRRIGFRQRYVMQESISAPQVGGIVRLTGFILRFTLAMELVSAVLLAFRFIPEFGFVQGAWYGLFHSVSAFCNAGFDLMGVRAPFSSLVCYTGDWLVNLVIMVLIVSGGIGFFAWSDILRNKFLNITITLKANDWKLDYEVLDWDDHEVNINFTDILSYTSAGWTEDTYMNLFEGNVVQLYPDQPAELKFTIDAPNGALWRAALEGDVDAFEFVDGINSGNVYNEGSPQEQTIKIKVTDPESDERHEATLRVFADIAGKTYELDLTNPGQDMEGGSDAINRFTLLQSR